MDEPALREGLPLKASRHEEYLRWAVNAFRLATGCASPSVQVSAVRAHALYMLSLLVVVRAA